MAYHTGTEGPWFTKPVPVDQTSERALRVPGARQSHRMSFAEAIANIVIGYGVAVAANWLVLPLFGFPVSMGDSAAIGLVFTGVAVIRSYALRRLFEEIRVRNCRNQPAATKSG